MTTKIAINGFGRIGRCITRHLLADPNTGLELVAINDLTDNETLAHLLKFDSLHRTLDADVSSTEDAISPNGRSIKALSEADPGKLPWKDLGVDVVLECTGRFVDKVSASKHLSAGAKRVII
ncbi:MAG: type I glyceraldehyde-3-phosphate dehydrogenase, partial [Myxococcales bacterium]|nr:type I glyceraldehyde-3-phosphate dehydrogenase [Myxococcales bacterium]